MKEKITLSMREIHRLKILEQVDEGALSLISGTEVLKISYRHGKRLLARYCREGPSGLAHKRRGRVAHNAFDPAIRERVIKLHQERYSQFNDTHFVEMLAEREGLRISRETVRRWLREAGIGPKRRRRAPRHPRRPQKGLMMQMGVPINGSVPRDLLAASYMPPMMLPGMCWGWYSGLPKTPLVISGCLTWCSDGMGSPLLSTRTATAFYNETTTTGAMKKSWPAAVSPLMSGESCRSWGSKPSLLIQLKPKDALNDREVRSKIA